MDLSLVKRGTLKINVVVVPSVIPPASHGAFSLHPMCEGTK